MNELQANTTTHPQTHQQGGRDARQRLLEALPVTERRLHLNGISTAVLTAGEGPPLILLHGPGEHTAKWFTVIPRLQADYHVIAPDLPGHGESEPVEGAVDVERLVGWLDDLVECTCAEPPVLVGHIIGGAIAARYAAARGERLRRLVLVDALGLAPFQPTPEFHAALTGFLSDPTEETHDQFWRLCAFDLDAMRGWMGERWDWLKAYNLDRARNPAVQQAMHEIMTQFGFPAIPPAELSGITVPTSLIWGEHDLATPLAAARAAAEQYGWPLRVVASAADDPPIEKPDDFLEALRAVLDDAAPTPDTRAEWDRIAPGYDRNVTPTHESLGREGLGRAGLEEGDRFLDVAAGSGALSLAAARLGARVLATDQSPVMLDLLATRARAEGLNIETRIMDGHALELDDGSFDMAGSQFGVMLFPDMPRGIREMARVVRPGGRVLLHAFANPGEIEFLGFLIGAVKSVRPEFDGPPSDPPPLEFQLANPETLRTALAAAGLGSVSVETVSETMAFRDGSELWDWLVSSNPIVERILGGLDLSRRERETVKQALGELVAERAGDTGVARLTSPVNIGIGTR